MIFLQECSSKKWLALVGPFCAAPPSGFGLDRRSRAVVLVVVALLALRVKTIPHELVGPLVVLEQ